MVKLGIHATLLSDAAPEMPAGTKVHVVALEPLTVATKAGLRAAVAPGQVKFGKGRPVKISLV